jgi:rubrerythrin
VGSIITTKIETGLFSNEIVGFLNNYTYNIRMEESNMTIKTIKDILNYAREFHTQLREFYSLLSSRSEKQRIKLLLDYMSQHEKYLEETLSRYIEKVSEQVLNNWFQYPPPQEIITNYDKKNIEKNENLTVDDVIEMAVKLDQLLLDLYNEIIKHSETDEMREVFTNLMEMEKRQELELVRDAQEWKDL